MRHVSRNSREVTATVIIKDDRSAIIFFFSGTGNTWWVAEEFSKQLSEKGLATKAYSIETVSQQEINELIKSSTITGFAYPVHASDLPRPMIKFLRSLPEETGKKTFIICTQWIWSGDGAAVGASILKDKGYDVLWGEHVLMPNNVAVSVIRLPYTNDPAKLKPVLKRAGRRLDRFADKIISGKVSRHGFNPVSRFLGSMQRVPYRLVYRRLQNDIAVDHTVCIDCGQCVRLCPVNNIVCSEGEYLTRGNCIICLRCYNACPVAAITYMKRRHNLKRGQPYRGPVKEFKPGMLVGNIEE